MKNIESALLPKCVYEVAAMTRSVNCESMLDSKDLLCANV